MKGKHHSKETKLSLSRALIAYYSTRNGPMKGRKSSNESKKKMRLARIKDLNSKFGSCYPNYNKDACKIFNKLNEQNN